MLGLRDSEAHGQGQRGVASHPRQELRQSGREIPAGAGDPRHAHAIQEAAGLRGHERDALLARGGRQEVDQVQPAAGAGGLHRRGLFRRHNAFKGTKTRFCVVSFTSDWLYPTRESREIVQALNAVAANVSFVEIESDKGHDAFLLEEPELFAAGARLHQRRGRQARAEERPGDALMLAPVAPPNTRVDHLLIAEMVTAGSRVLDVGCGDGALLQLLGDTKDVDGRGIEVARERVNACVARGLSVIQGDADRDLADYPDGAFDYAILSLTIQATRQPETVLENLLRIARSAIVSFPNFGHWQVRARLRCSPGACR